MPVPTNNPEQSARLAAIEQEVDELIDAANAAEDRRQSFERLAAAAIASQKAFVAEKEAEGVEFVSQDPGFAAHYLAVSSYQRSMHLAGEEKDAAVERINKLELEACDLRCALMGIEFD